MRKTNYKNSDIGKVYKKVIKEKYNSFYEHYRWFNNVRNWSEYYMNFYALNRIIEKLKFSSVLELGAGPGTWTKNFFFKNPLAKIDIVDISKDMIKQAGLNIGQRKTINFINKDFLKFDTTKKYDVFFSSRAIEYIKDKDPLFKKIFKFLKKGGKGIIITKTPHNFEKRSYHNLKIGPKEISAKLKENGFKKIKCYPAIIALPLLGRFFFFNLLLWKLLYKNQVSIFNKRFCESYLVYFEK
jgi:trans-aconitate methyltransferase